MKKFLDLYIPIIISILLFIFIFINLNNKYDVVIIISFVLVILANLALMLILSRKKFAYFDSIISIFYILFFVIAPVLQLSKGSYPQNFYINENYIVISNICNMLFLFSYIIFRYIKFNRYSNENKVINKFKISKFTMIIMGLIFAGFFMINLPMLIQQVVNRSEVVLQNQIMGLLITKFIMYIPLFFVYYFIIEYKEKKSKKILFYLIIWFIILIICKNPFTDKRNGIGPIYLSIFLFIILKKYNARNFLIYISVIFIIGLPITAVITNTKLGLNEVISNFSKYFNSDQILKQFYELHFDAYSNLNVAIEYVKIYGVSFGKQLIGAFLFFIPRELWVGKPLNSGMLTGNYLIDNYGFFYNNLSSPITAEAYFNGGLVGIIIFAFIFSKWSKLVYRWLSSNSYYTLVAWYMTIHLFFLMRGDLMNGIAYLMGPICAIYFLPLGIERVRKFFIKIRI